MGTCRRVTASAAGLSRSRIPSQHSILSHAILIPSNPFSFPLRSLTIGNVTYAQATDSSAWPVNSACHRAQVIVYTMQQLDRPLCKECECYLQDADSLVVCLQKKYGASKRWQSPADFDPGPARVDTERGQQQAVIEVPNLARKALDSCTNSAYALVFKIRELNRWLVH